MTFFLVVIGIWALAHLYVGWRLWGPEPAYRWGLGLTLLVSFATAPTSFIVMSRSGELWADVLQGVGFVAMGAFSILWVLTVARDLAWLAALGLDKVVAVLPEDPDRRAFLRRGLDVGVLGASAVLTTAAVVRAKMGATVEVVEVLIEDLPSDLNGFRIAQVSDIHVGATVRRGHVQAIVDQVNALEADLIAITGDLVDGSVEGLTPHVDPLRGLKATHGAAFCTGNHEYYSGAGPWCAKVEELGIRVLTNASVVLEHGDARVLLAGVPDRQGGRFLEGHRPDPVAVAEAAEPADVRVLLSHQPITATEGARAGFDLQLSGHTHAGQYFPFTLFIRLGQRWTEGLHRVGEMWLYVNRGTTWWGPPLRLGAPQEVTLLTLRRA